MIQYKTVAGPVGFTISHKENQAEAIKQYAAIINREAVDGWKLHSMQKIPITQEVGCIAGLLGAKTSSTDFNMLIFIREDSDKKTQSSKAINKSKNSNDQVTSTRTWLVDDSTNTNVISTNTNIKNVLTDSVDTDLKATSRDNTVPEFSIGKNGNWFIDSMDTGVKATEGESVDPEFSIGENDNWFINGVDTNVRAGW